MSEGDIKFRCPSCSKIYKVSQQLAGRRFKCKQCEAAIAVPRPADSSTSPSCQAKIRCTCSHCSRTFNLPQKFAGKKFKCPQCHKVIQASTAPSTPPAAPKEEPDDTWNPLADYSESDTNSESFNDIPSQEEQTSSRSFQLPVSGNMLGIIIASVVGFIFLISVGSYLFKVRSAFSDLGEAQNISEEARLFSMETETLLIEQNIDNVMKRCSPALQGTTEKETLRQISRLYSEGDQDQSIKHSCIKTGDIQSDPDYLSYFASIDPNNDYSLRLFLLFHQTSSGFMIDGLAFELEKPEHSREKYSIGPFQVNHLMGQYQQAFEQSVYTLVPGVLTLLGLMLIFFVIQPIARWRVFTKAEEHGWAALIPIYASIVLARVGGKPGWWGLLLFFSPYIPMVGALIGLLLWILICFGVSETFDRGRLFGLGLCFLPYIFFPILAFSE